LLGTLEERVELLTANGIDQVILAPFDRQFAEQTAETFVRSIIVERLRAAAVVVGEDFRYGRDRMGDIETLRRAGERYDFGVAAVPQIFVNGVPVRSTEIRRLIAVGDVAQAAALLGRPYRLCGEVVRGRQLGRTIGFPTANLSSDPSVLVPGPGVYAGAAYVDGERHRAAISVGNNPTVAPEGTTLPRTVEAFLLDGFDRDIYGSRISFEFLFKLREMVKFANIDALVIQMQADVREIIRRSS
jgi:riboflavin kinase/FMN adenylyltransferase